MGLNFNINCYLNTENVQASNECKLSQQTPSFIARRTKQGYEHNYSRLAYEKVLHGDHISTKFCMIYQLADVINHNSVKRSHYNETTIWMKPYMILLQ